MWSDGSGRAPPPPDDSGDAADAVFKRKLAKFEAADARFRALADALDTYQQAVTAMADAGVAVADALAGFFDQPSGGGGGGGGSGPSTTSGGAGAVLAGKAVSSASTGGSNLIGGECGDGGVSSTATPNIPGAFRAAQMAIRSKWTQDVMQRFDDDVCKAVQDSLDQFPQVRAYIKQRSAAQLEMARRQKKLKDAGTRVRDKQRKWRECSDRYKMFDDEVMQRFSNIGRAQPGLVAKPLRMLVLLLDEFSRDAAAAMRDVAQLVTTASPVMTRDFEPPPRHDAHTSGGMSLAHNGGEDEGWDEDFDFLDNDVGSGSARGSYGGRPGASTEVKAASTVDGSGAVSGRHSRPHSVAAVPARLVVSDTGTRRAASGPPLAPAPRCRAPAPLRFPADTADNVHAPAVSSAETDHLSPQALQAVSSEGCRSSVTGQLQTASVREVAWDADSRSEREKVLMRLAATFDFTPTETNELPLRDGGIIEVYEQHSSGWWLGRTNHVTGYFPRNHARSITQEEEVDFINERARRRRERRRGHRRRDSMSASQSSLTAAATAATSGGTPSAPSRN
jgi:Variant SH3 domain